MNTSKRYDWEFEYTAAKLAEASEQKRLSHETRKAWWETKKAEVMKKVGESGIEVKDSLASAYSNTKGGYGPQIVIDDGLQRDLCEAQAKILEHDTLVREYSGWVQVLRANPEARLKLTCNDYLFFFGE